MVWMLRPKHSGARARSYRSPGPSIMETSPAARGHGGRALSALSEEDNSFARGSASLLCQQLRSRGRPARRQGTRAISSTSPRAAPTRRTGDNMTVERNSTNPSPCAELSFDAGLPSSASRLSDSPTAGSAHWIGTGRSWTADDRVPSLRAFAVTSNVASLGYHDSVGRPPP
jgi:hypothetical protein